MEEQIASINGRQEQHDSLDNVSGKIQVFYYNFYDLLDRCASLSFGPHFVASNIDVIPEQLSTI